MKFKYFIILIVSINLTCFAVAAVDKRLSKNGHYGSTANKNKRIAETSLVTFSAFGGAAGSLLGFYIFHHKISKEKQYLRLDLYLLLIQNFLFYFLIYKVFVRRE